MNKLKTLFLEAVKNNDIEKVKFFLHSNSIAPSFSDNILITTASQSGLYEIVKLLLKDSRVNPRAKSDYSAQLASANGHYDVVKALLDDYRIEKYSIFLALHAAIGNRHVDICHLILNNYELDFSIQPWVLFGTAYLSQLLSPNQQVDYRRSLKTLKSRNNRKKGFSSH